MSWLSVRRRASSLLFIYLSLGLMAALVTLAYDEDLRSLGLSDPSPRTTVELGAEDFDEDPELQPRRTHICGHHMRPPSFRKFCQNSETHYHWDGASNEVEQKSKFAGTKPLKSECDHIVELQWLHEHIYSDEEAGAKCDEIAQAKKDGIDHPDGKRLQGFVASQTNAMYVTTNVNRLKGLYNNHKTSEEALRNKHPHHTRATADYVAKTKGRAEEVVAGVYGIFPTLQEKYMSHGKVTTAEDAVGRTFDVHIGAHIHQMLEDCRKNAENCPPGGPVASKKRPKTPQSASNKSARTESRGLSQGASNSHVGKAEEGPIASSSSTEGSALRTTRSRAQKEASGCNSLKRSLCQYKPKGATAAPHDKQSPKSSRKGGQFSTTRSSQKAHSWSSQRTAVLSTLRRTKESQAGTHGRSTRTKAKSQSQQRKTASRKFKPSMIPSWADQRRKAMSIPRSSKVFKSKHKSVQKSRTPSSTRAARQASVRSGAGSRSSSHSARATSRVSKSKHFKTKVSSRSASLFNMTARLGKAVKPASGKASRSSKASKAARARAH